MGRMFRPALELTHNHGTESDPNFSYHNGNEDPRGFGHVCFLVDDLRQKYDELVSAGYNSQKAPDGGWMKNVAFVRDPDGYWVELLQRGLPPACDSKPLVGSSDAC
eukprot:NODE_2969_length_514_cov_171.703226_g2569_i0.p2 GENE.NODE_2969_length_514_cov_171.703226_g2569_i0~~NODE_2969_length_514_cov_171.703226_g2569_i0.p2  ORF type:complete len:113 (-),score=31.31 NODE_2969_length_514_cov_171.703226_g2569_i0:175-492(-)